MILRSEPETDRDSDKATEDKAVEAIIEEAAGRARTAEDEAALIFVAINRVLLRAAGESPSSDDPEGIKAAWLLLDCAHDCVRAVSVSEAMTGNTLDALAPGQALGAQKLLATLLGAGHAGINRMLED